MPAEVAMWIIRLLSGADDFEEIPQWGRTKQPWLRGFLRLDYGVASPDTFKRVFALLDPKQFEQAFPMGDVVTAGHLYRAPIVSGAWIKDDSGGKELFRIESGAVGEFRQPFGAGLSPGSQKYSQVQGGFPSARYPTFEWLYQASLHGALVYSLPANFRV